LLVLSSCSGTDQNEKRLAHNGRLDLTDVRFQEGKIIDLEGNWYFWPDKLLSPAEVRQELREGSPKTVPVPAIWSETGMFASPKKMLTKGTVAMEVTLPDGIPTWAIRLPNADTACTLFLDEQETVRIGMVGATKETCVPRTGMEVVPFIPRSRQVLITMQVSNFNNNATGLWSSPSLGDYPSISQKRNYSIFFTALISGALLFTGLYHLMQYLFRRKDSSALLFGLICLLVAMYNLFVGERIIISLFPYTRDGWELAGKLEYLSAHMTLPLFMLFFKRLYPNRVNDVALKLSIGVSLAWAALVILSPAFVHHPFLSAYLIFAILTAIYMLLVLVKAMIEKDDGAAIIIVGLSIMTLTIINDTLLTSSVIHTFYMFSLGMYIFLFSQAILLSRRSSRLFARVEQYAHELVLLNQSLERFIPHEVLKFLGKKSIINVNLGDFSLEDMSVFILDIRDFTAMSESMTPTETFTFINNFLNHFGPIVRNNGGFIDKYLGDGFMALFPGDADHALNAALSMREELVVFNERHRDLYSPTRFGIGVHKGALMLGTIGESMRMDSTVISDTVNTASRLEELTKKHRADILVSAETIQKLAEPERFTLTKIGSETVKGKKKAIEIYTLEAKLDELPILAESAD
jgi:class 3 adenylate cyclase